MIERLPQEMSYFLFIYSFIKQKSMYNKKGKKFNERKPLYLPPFKLYLLTHLGGLQLLHPLLGGDQLRLQSGDLLLHGHDHRAELLRILLGLKRSSQRQTQNLLIFTDTGTLQTSMMTNLPGRKSVFLYQLLSHSARAFNVHIFSADSSLFSKIHERLLHRKLLLTKTSMVEIHQIIWAAVGFRSVSGFSPLKFLLFFVLHRTG